jgi:RHS repeat-associated protein
MQIDWLLGVVLDCHCNWGLMMNARLLRTSGTRFSAIVLSIFLIHGEALGQTTIRYIHTDALGSPVAFSDLAGNVLEQDIYDPYGSSLMDSRTDTPSFAGHVVDASTNFSYMQQRYYDGAVGRFVSVDPVSAYAKPIDNFNRYFYAAGNPYRFRDPDGRDIDCNLSSCKVHPIDGGIPDVTFPRPSGFPGHINPADSFFHHMYRFNNSVGKSTSERRQRLSNELVKSPTPIKNKPATSKGNPVDVNAENAVSRFTGTDTVMSYKFAMPNGTNGVINVTTGDHAATWGVVLRVIDTATDGTDSIITYGEGNSALQSIFDNDNSQSEQVWRDSSNQISDRAN